MRDFKTAQGLTEDQVHSISSILETQATDLLDENAEDELEIEDPENEKAKAALSENQLGKK